MDKYYVIDAIVALVLGVVLICLNTFLLGKKMNRFQLVLVFFFVFSIYWYAGQLVNDATRALDREMMRSLRAGQGFEGFSFGEKVEIGFRTAAGKSAAHHFEILSISAFQGLLWAAALDLLINALGLINRASK